MGIQCPLCFNEEEKEIEMEVEASWYSFKGTIEVSALCPECNIIFDGSLR